VVGGGRSGGESGRQVFSRWVGRLDWSTGLPVGQHMTTPFRKRFQSRILGILS